MEKEYLTEGQKERCQRYEQRCKEVGFVPLHGNPYEKMDGITYMELLNNKYKKTGRL